MCTILYKCFFCLYMQQEIQEKLQLCISMLWWQVFLIVFKTLVCDYLSIKSQTDFIFYIDIALDLPKHLWCWVDKTLSCLENIYLDTVSLVSSMKIVGKFEKFEVAKFRKNLCCSLLFNKVAGWKPSTLSKRDHGTCVFLWILWVFQEHLYC